jgi:hypothetical protein
MSRKPVLKNVRDVRARALSALLPPTRLQLSEWIEANIRLPQGTTAIPGPMRLWPYQRAIADSIGCRSHVSSSQRPALRRTCDLH